LSIRKELHLASVTSSLYLHRTMPFQKYNIITARNEEAQIEFARVMDGITYV
jgi:hypothetical protein